MKQTSVWKLFERPYHLYFMEVSRELGAFGFGDKNGNNKHVLLIMGLRINNNIQNHNKKYQKQQAYPRKLYVENLRTLLGY